MEKILVIVESPSKIKKVTKILNEIYKGKYDFIVLASYGHIRDLDSKNLSIDVEDNFKPIYVKGQNKDRVISELKKASKESKEVWIATDGDREGEAIAFHISELLRIKPPKRKRITFSEITKTALKQACDSPTDINMNMFYAQQARRVLDRLIGYKISPILWSQIQNSTKKKISLSAGRVQSVVMKLLIEREKEINNYESSGYYRTLGGFKLNNKDTSIKTELSHKLTDKVKVKTFLNNCKEAEFIVDSVIIKKSTRKPSPPFITSTLQQESSTKLRFSPKMTMDAAQKLYEAGFITYMRTDSVELSKDAIDMITEYVTSNYGDEYLKVNYYKNKGKKNAQEAHEAIRPCNINTRNIDDNSSLGNYEKRLYSLIWRRTVASQMSPAKVDILTTKISISNVPEYYFTSKSEKITFDGFLKVYKPSNIDEDEEDDKLETKFIKLKKGDKLTYESIISNEKFTKPPHGRFSEASLVKKLDEMGIGRPSTYSNMVTVVQDRNYAVKKDKEGEEKPIRIYHLKSNNIEKKQETIKVGGEKQKLFPSQIGIIVNEFLLKHFDNIIDYKFTSKIEDSLDEISNGTELWCDIVKKIYEMFNPKVVELSSGSNMEKDKYKRILGNDPDTGYQISTYIAKYGPVVQLSQPDNKHKFAPLKDIDIKDVTLEQALNLLKYPYILCNYKSNEVTVCKGKYGVYLKYNNKNYSIKEHSEESLKNKDTLKSILEETANKEDGEQKSGIIKTINNKIVIKNGKYGPYISYKNKLNVKIYGNKKPEDLTQDDCIKMINKKKQNQNKSK